MRVLLGALLIMVQAADPGITTHVLDLSLGLPGKGVKVEVFKQANTGSVDSTKWELMSTV